MGRTSHSRRPYKRPKRDRGFKIDTESHPSSQRHRQARPGIRRADASKIGLGDLPAELRNHIYEIALKPSLSRSIRVIQRVQEQKSRHDLALGLLCTCKAVRREAWSFLYEKNDFRIDCVKPPPRPTVPCSDELHPNDSDRTTYTGISHLNSGVICFEVC